MLELNQQVTFVNKPIIVIGFRLRGNIVLNITQLKQKFNNSADNLIDAKNQLTEIDSKFGDADHGVTMEKIANTIKKTIEKSDTNSVKHLVDDIGTAIMMLNGGSAVPLWSTFITGLSVGAPDKDNADVSDIKNMFKCGLEELKDITKARVGQKTMMDVIIPASQAIIDTDLEENQIFNYAGEVAKKCADDTKNMISEFGRAKSYKEKTIGTPDAGAMSAMYFFLGLDT